MIDIKKYFTKTESADGTDRKKLNMVIVWMIIIAILVLAFNGFGDNSKKNETPASTKIEDVKNQEEYTRLMEERLEATLSKIAGAGMVSVMLIVDSDGEKVFATDTKTKTNKQAKSETAESSNTEEEENIVIAGQGASGQPVIVEEKRPYPSGILVVAEGAKDETVRYEIYEAVKALYDLSPHRIKVTY